MKFLRPTHPYHQSAEPVGYCQLSSLLGEQFSAAELSDQAASRIPSAMAVRRMSLKAPPRMKDQEDQKVGRPKTATTGRTAQFAASKPDPPSLDQLPRTGFPDAPARRKALAWISGIAI